MKKGWRTAAMAAAGALALAIATAAVSAQTDQQEECRCADSAGNEIENCTCLRMPSFDFSGMSAFSMSRPRLGISVDVRQGGARDEEGALVTHVLEDGPADEAGIREGDVITRIDGRSLFDPIDPALEETVDPDRSVPVQRLLAIARDLEPGDEVELEYLRDGVTRSTVVEAEDLAGRMDVSVFGPGWDPEELEERMRDVAERTRELQLRIGPEAQELQRRARERVARMDDVRRDIRVFGPGRPGPGVVIGGLGFGQHGLELVEVNPELGQYFGVSEGALVVDIDDDSVLGLQPGDVILAIGDRESPTPGRIYRILGSYGEDEDIRFRVRRAGAEMEVTGRLDR